MDGEDDTMEEQDPEDVIRGRDLTIYLLPNSTTEKASACPSPKTYTRKRGRSAGMERSPEVGNELGPGPVLCEIHANSSRLRQCSKYFEALMSEKWTVQTERDQPSSAMKVHLEVQTEIRYYQDCFSRMIFLHQPIGGVKHCIELLKVASQIEYKELMDISLRCLSATPWSSDEEEQIHEFCASGQYFSLKSADDLRSRLRLDLTETQKQTKVVRYVARTLNRYLRCAFTPQDEELSVDVKKEESRKVLEKAFEAIVYGAVRGKTSESVLRCALTIAKAEAEDLISSFKEFDYEADDTGIFSTLSWKINRSAFGNETRILNLWWLFQTLRKANAAHVVVEALLAHEDFADLLKNNSDLSARLKKPVLNELIPVVVVYVQSTMREMMMVIFEDVLNGRLFLDYSDRMKLFLDWDWLLHDCFSPCPHPSPCSSFVDESAASRSTNRARVLASYIMSFPLKQQEDLNRTWMERSTEPEEYGFLRENRVEVYRDLKQAHVMWMMNLVSRVPLRKEKQAASPEEKEPISSAAGTSNETSECGTSESVPTEGGSACAVVQAVDENVGA